MPSRAARWISWMTSRLKIAPSRRPGGQPRAADRRSTSSWALPRTSNSVIAVSEGPGVDRTGGSSVLARVVDVEVVELARRAIAAELAGRHAVRLGPLQQRRQLVHVLVAHLLLDAVRAEVGDPATHVDMRLVDRVAERLARVAADQ